MMMKILTADLSFLVGDPIFTSSNPAISRNSARHFSKHVKCAVKLSNPYFCSVTEFVLEWVKKIKRREREQKKLKQKL